MQTDRGRLTGASLIALCALTSPQCASKPDAATALAEAGMTATVSVKELMESIIDPISDNIFDAVATDVSAKGVVETKPVTDEDWAKVRQGAVTLAEATNLLKMPRRIAPPGDKNNSGGRNAPELSPEQIQAKIDQDRTQWNKHADELREEALKVLAIINRKNADELFDAGSRLDRACENCHLEYWYPGDKKAVLEDEAKRATITPAPPKK